MDFKLGMWSESPYGAAEQMCTLSKNFFFTGDGYTNPNYTNPNHANPKNFKCPKGALTRLFAP